MSSPFRDSGTSNELAAALDRLAGRRSDLEVPAAWVGYATRVREAVRRLDAAPVCPTPVLRRMEALFRERTRSLARLVFDSWSALAPSVRGLAAPRLLRYAGDDVEVDVEVERHEGRVALRVAVVPSEGLAIRVLVDDSERARSLTIDASGAGHLRLPVGAEGVTLVLERGRREVLRTPQVPVR